MLLMKEVLKSEAGKRIDAKPGVPSRYGQRGLDVNSADAAPFTPWSRSTSASLFQTSIAVYEDRDREKGVSASLRV